jgi:TPR repeat protein
MMKILGTLFLLTVISLAAFGEQVADVSAIQKDADHGKAEAQCALGQLYEKGQGVPKDDTEAERWYLKAAEQGHAKAERLLGLLYLRNNSLVDARRQLPQSNGADAFKEAERLLYKAEKHGDTTAQAELGYKYYCGQFGSNRLDQGVELMKRAYLEHPSEHFEAETSLGMILASIYDNGQYTGIPLDVKEASKWILKAAERGGMQAQAEIGLRYLRGKGVPVNYQESEGWYLKAAEQGAASIQEALGYIYYAEVFGRGRTKEAIQWTRKAADQGRPFAQYVLGQMYEHGVGTATNLTEAYKWYNVSAANGWTDAIIPRDNTAQRLTPPQLAEAQRQSSEVWKRNTELESEPLSSTNWRSRFRKPLELEEAVNFVLSKTHKAD